MAGLGIAPFGTAPFGVGTPATATAPPTGDYGTRYIQANTGDYEKDPTTGQLKQMPTIRQRVLLAILTIRGSSTVLPTLGIKTPRKMGSRFENEMRTAVRAALSYEINVAKVIRITGILIDRQSPAGRVLVTVAYTDLTLPPGTPGAAPLTVGF